MGRKDISHIRKPEILEHAYKVVAREGFIGATITKIAKEMGVNSGLLMHYFKSKEELILALVDFMAERNMANYRKTVAQYEAPPERKLEAVIDIYFDREIPSLTRGSVFWSCYALGFRNPTIMAAIQNMYEEFFRNTIQYLKDANMGNRIKIDDPDLMACILLSFIDGLGWFRMTLDEKRLPKVKQAYQVVKKLVKEMLGLSESEGTTDLNAGQTSLREEYAFNDVVNAETQTQQESPDLKVDRIIDLRLPVPPSQEFIAKRLKTMFSDPKAVGVANYQRIFGPKWAEKMGMSVDELLAKISNMSEKAKTKTFLEMAEPLAMTPESLIAQMDENNVEWGMIFSENNEETAELITKFPSRFKGMAMTDPQAGNAAREIENAIKEQGFSTIYASPFHAGIHANDPKFFPIYAKALELNIPVFIYTAMNYNKQLPMDIGHPKYVDSVAMAFPNLQIVASLGGWPWINEMVGVARRHRNVYIDTSFHRPKHLATPESGWGMLLQFANTLLQDQMLFGSGMGDMGIPLSVIVKEMNELPIKEVVKQKWFYDNASKLFG